MHLTTLSDAHLADLEARIREAVATIRQTLADRDIGSFDFTIRAHGRTFSGDAHLSFHLSEEYGATLTKSSTIRPLIEEFLHRKGFDTRHAPLALPAPGTELEEIF